MLLELEKTVGLEVDAGRNLEDETSLALLLAAFAWLCCCAIGVARSESFGGQGCEVTGRAARCCTSESGKLSCLFLFFGRAAD